MPISDAIGCNPFSRRGFLRGAGALSALAAIPGLTEAHLALAQHPHFDKPESGIHIDANENPLGPSEGARAALAAMIPKGGRYQFPIQVNLIETFAKQQGLDPDSVLAYAGSGEPLQYAVLAFTSKDRPLVTVDVTFEAPWWAAEASGTPILKVPVADPKGAASHDPKTLLAASSNPGLIYVCNPNNPTGTVTPRKDIEAIVSGAPKDTVILIDEAYIHFSDTPSCLDMVKDGKNVIVLRTFSKLYGMAGLRLGFAIGRPDLVKKLNYFGQNSLPVTTIAAALASLTDPTLVPTRKKIIGDIRRSNLAWMKANGFHCTPSDCNCYMVDVNRPGKEVIAAMAKKDIYIGRAWEAWPNSVRITIGTASEMEAFQTAFREVMSMSSTAGLEPEPLHPRMRNTPFVYLS
ncbi:MAG TPA: pyridoxal phosphate-dependent aminotransferase [Acidobacteriaceae bacterium]|nr:pyridoxal phosphate-dependent aminotransferase [Acidobacteriaceae bacterium]